MHVHQATHDIDAGGRSLVNEISMTKFCPAISERYITHTRAALPQALPRACMDRAFSFKSALLNANSSCAENTHCSVAITPCRFKPALRNLRQ